MSGAYPHELSSHEMRELLRIARATLRELCTSGRMPPGAPHSQTLLAPAAVDVEVRLATGTLHGAHAQGTLPVYKAIQQGLVEATRAARPAPGALDTAVIAVVVHGTTEQAFDETTHPPPAAIIYKR